MPCRFVAAVSVAALSSLTACVRISSTTIAVAPPATVRADSVRVFVTKPPETYAEVAVLKAHRFLVTDAKVLSALRQKAADLGANGILLVNAANAATQTHSGAAVIIGGRDNGNVVVGNAKTEVDEFEKAVAIRWSAKQ
jgi:hypothetical protein